MKPTLQFRLSQHLTLTPQLQQSIRLLQLSTVELNQEIERLIAENPVLDRDEAGSEGEASPAPVPRGGESGAAPADSGTDSGAASEPGPAEEWSADASATWQGADEDGEDDRNFGAHELPSLRAHLYEQLSLTNLGERDRALIGLLIDALDDDGYLTMTLEEVAALVSAEAELDVAELATALRHVQNFEPTGVGARSPGECLALQLRAREHDEGSDAVSRLALVIVEQHLGLLAHHDYVRLRGATGASEEALRDAQQLIRSLNPRPGAAFARVETRYVVPDVIVRKIRHAWRASLNQDAMPKLRLNRLYAGLAAGKRGAGNALATQIQEARWLIKNIQQRFETILRVSQAIVERQRSFFEHGEVAMRPLVLREIAETLGLHESTVSRVTTQKYMATPRGIFELKYFFGSHVTTDTGGSASSTAIRALIRQLVAAEDVRKPLSDSRISQILGQQGIVVARRTIAKYREALHIPPVNLRKTL